jgi:hypothetical protein
MQPQHSMTACHQKEELPVPLPWSCLLMLAVEMGVGCGCCCWPASAATTPSTTPQHRLSSARDCLQDIAGTQTYS